METTKVVAEKLIKYLRRQDFITAYEELFSPDAVSFDPLKPDSSPVKGLAVLIDHEKAFLLRIKISTIEISDPVYSGSYFALSLFMKFTLEGSEVNFNELCVYQVQNGKISSQQFFINN
ncbi:nuclear transport factor 2 family protein [Mucilaginibacter gilvus]|uniref:Nuclear transport factor 2 family protein n=1 Tax=Mucilaginibacter gilvus TaxID=2305909 RepID=A0A3S3VLG7_9SPHI|nr:nuclear transport factor 2 family protein [Mucilaginibacter gilvus]RWY55915.1 nuclear transport factor 2 family protein [Mucilaginibacter gilvus]